MYYLSYSDNPAFLITRHIYVKKKKNRKNVYLFIIFIYLFSLTALCSILPPVDPVVGLVPDFAKG